MFLRNAPETLSEKGITELVPEVQEYFLVTRSLLSTDVMTGSGRSSGVYNESFLVVLSGHRSQ